MNLTPSETNANIIQNGTDDVWQRYNVFGLAYWYDNNKRYVDITSNNERRKYFQQFTDSCAPLIISLGIIKNDKSTKAGSIWVAGDENYGKNNI